MEPAVKPARGRRRQAAKKITKLEEYTNIENEKDEREQENLPAPMPSVSQRLTNSLKHISQLGGRLKPGDGEEVDQGVQEESPNSNPLENLPKLKLSSPIRNDYACITSHLNLTRLSNMSSIHKGVYAVLIVLMAALLCHWNAARHINNNVKVLGEEIMAIKSTGLHCEPQIRDVQRVQTTMQEKLSLLTTAVETLQTTHGSRNNTAIEKSVAALRSWLNELDNSLSYQHVLLQQIKQQNNQKHSLSATSFGDAKEHGIHVLEGYIGSDATFNEIQKSISSLVKAEVQHALDIYEADKTGLVDYAQALIGGRVIAHSPLQCAYAHGGFLNRLSNIMGLHKLHPRATEFVLSPKVTLGQCLPLSGSTGYVDILLGNRIFPTSFSYEHIPASIALDARSAPVTMVVYAMNSTLKGGNPNLGQQIGISTGQSVTGSSDSTTSLHAMDEVEIAGEHKSSNFPLSSRITTRNAPHEDDLEGEMPGMLQLGKLQYDIRQGCTVQTAHLRGDLLNEPIQNIRVEVKGNHGHPRYTCLYRIRVHGDKDVI